ncbi:MAG TPA: hypothetical protein VKB57_17295, partial [Acidimicrobiales bacterium]|nr:hypothetical protein [Acidimicrobiales bacterium]
MPRRMRWWSLATVVGAAALAGAAATSPPAPEVTTAAAEPGGAATTVPATVVPTTAPPGPGDQGWPTVEDVARAGGMRSLVPLEGALRQAFPDAFAGWYLRQDQMPV